MYAFDYHRPSTFYDPSLEQWLINEVLPILEATKADPSRLLSADDAWKWLNAHMTK